MPVGRPAPVKALHASIRTTFAERQMRINKHKSAEDTWKEVLQIYESLIKTSPNVLLYERRHSDTLESLAELRMKQGDRESARNYLEQAIEGLQIAIKRSPNSPVIRMQLNRLMQRARRQANVQASSSELEPASGK